MNKSLFQEVFVCANISESGELITKVIPAATKEVAIEYFTKEFFLPPKDVYGPFLNKKHQIVEKVEIFKFSSKSKKAIYNDWMVNAFMLADPIDYAYLVFIKRVDDKISPKPKGIITVPLSTLRFI